MLKIKKIKNIVIHSWLNKLGPGLITGAADDDPSGIATYSQGGAQAGYNLLWTIFLTYPLMVAIQLISALIGRVTGEGLASNLRRHYPISLLASLVGLLVIANTINIAANIAAMGDALKLVIGGDRETYAIAIGMLSLLLQIFIPYHRYVRVLSWFTLSLFAYVAVIFTIQVPWNQVIISTLWPSLSFDSKYITTVVAIFGTTISPYLFFWQASQEVEEIELHNEKPLKQEPNKASTHLQRIKVDTYIGMGFSNIIAFCIMLTAAATLHVHGITDISTSAQAAEALRPIAGEFTFLLFSIGIVGTGLLAVPVLAGSAAYAMAGAFNWNKGLGLKWNEAKQFYGIIAISTLMGIAIGFTTIDPIKALYWSAVINGVIAVPIMAVMVLMGSQPKIMGTFVISKRLKMVGWTATFIMAAAVIFMFVSML